MNHGPSGSNPSQQDTARINASGNCSVCDDPIPPAWEVAKPERFGLVGTSAVTLTGSWDIESVGKVKFTASAGHLVGTKIKMNFHLDSGGNSLTVLECRIAPPSFQGGDSPIVQSVWQPADDAHVLHLALRIDNGFN
jgi:hypothetical protein